MSLSNKQKNNLSLQTPNRFVKKRYSLTDKVGDVIFYPIKENHLLRQRSREEIPRLLCRFLLERGSFGSADNSYAFRMMKLFKKSGINFISCPTENIYLQGRQDTYPKRRGLTRVKEFHDNGINVCFAQDSMSDPWYPLGNGNMMMILDHGIHIAQMMSPAEIEDALDLVTVNGARTMDLEDYGIEVGKSANFIVLDAHSEFEAICERAAVLASVRKGAFLYQKKPMTIVQANSFLKQ